MELIESPVKAIMIDREWGPVTIAPIGDLQLGSAGAAKDHFRRHIAWCMDRDAYFIGMGDYVDVMSPSNRARLRGAGLYDSTHDALENDARARVDEFLKLVDGTKGRWLGLLEGHHYYEFRDGTTSDTRIATALDTAHLGSSAFVRLRFVHKTRDATVRCTIWCHHGLGSGALASAPLNRLERLVRAFDADVYLIGHYSKKVAAPLDQLYMTDRPPFTLKHRTKLIVATGGFSQGYLQGSREGIVPRGGYVEQGAMTPVALGGVLIHARPLDDRLDLHVEL